MHVDGARAAEVRHPPDAVEQLLPREDDAGMLEQPGQQLELLAGQLDGLAACGDLVRVAVQDDVAELERPLAAAALRSAGARP